MIRRSIAQLQRRYDQMDEIDQRAIHQVLSPVEAGILLFRTSELGCLTHITRHVVHWTATYRYEMLVGVQAECGISGTTLSRNPLVVIDPATETFGCHRCIEWCNKFGLPTYNLIPDNGCSATGGARFRPRPIRARPEFSDVGSPP